MKKIINLTRHPLFSGSFLMVGGAMVINIINYLYHLLMGRILGPSDYGVLASLYSLLYIVSIAPASTSMAIVKFISAAPKKSERIAIYYTIRKFVFYLAVILGMLVIGLSPTISNFLNIKSFWNVAIVGPILFLSLITLVNQSTLQGVLNFMGVVGPNFISSFGKLIFGLVFVFIGWSIFGAMVGVLIGAFIAFLLSVKQIAELIKSKPKNNFKILSFIKYSLPVLVQAIAFTSFFTTDVILVKHFFSPFEAGIYAALSTLGKIIFFASSPVVGTMFPIVVGRNARGENFYKVLLASLGITTLISFILVLVYFTFPDLLIKLLYGNAYLGARSNLAWMGMFIGFYCIAYLLTNFFLSIGKIRVVIIPFILSLIQIVAIWIWHRNILGVIQISLFIMIVLCLALLLYLGYNWELCKGKKAAKEIFL